MATVKDMSIAGPLGNFPIHIYTPEGKGPFPVMVYYRGGGFVIADSKTYDASPRAVANGILGKVTNVESYPQNLWVKPPVPASACQYGRPIYRPA